MKKILVIAGPTATGKTKLALKLAKKFNGELVSADSRQVYKHLDIGTGKDLPTNTEFEFQNSRLGGFYLVNKIRLWGYDLVDPDKEFSVAQYIKFARNIIKDIHTRNKLPILVGGTGLYLKGVIDGIETAEIPKDTALRKSYSKKQASELFKILTAEDLVKAASLNSSDRKNPRRLIRAIEIARSDLGFRTSNLGFTPYDSFWIGIKIGKVNLEEKIKKRVDARIGGVANEIEKLLESGITWSDQSMSSLGYRQWKGYFEGNKTLGDVRNEWIRDEIKYAKRQMTWFKKERRICWINPTSPKATLGVMEESIEKWYSQTKDAKEN